MNPLSPAQRILLTKATQQPDVCLSKHMQHMPRHIAQSMLDKLQQHGYVTMQHNDDREEYFITDAGIRAVSPEMPQESTFMSESCNHSQDTQKPSVAQIRRSATSDKTSKKNTLLHMLQSGTTIDALMQATGWQKHTVHGAISNLKRQQGKVIERLTQDNQPTVYRLVD